MIDTSNTKERSKEFFKKNELRDKSKYYSVGDKFEFELENENYLLTSFWKNKCMLLNMVTGKHFASTVDVQNKDKITENEWRQLTAEYGHHFKKI